jgi:hypothetical protein
LTVCFIKSLPPLSADAMKKSAPSTTHRFARSCISTGEGVASSLRLDFIGAQRRHYLSSFSSSSSKNPSLEKSDYENEDDDEDD